MHSGNGYDDDAHLDRKRRSTGASVDQLGLLIVSSPPGYRPGQVISLDMVMREAGVSRAMAREVLQVLHQKRLVGLRPRVGATIRPVEQWDVFDPEVIGWRLKVAPRFQVRSLTEVRQAIEPQAALLAAQRASADVCRDLVSLSRELRRLGLDKTFENPEDAGHAHREKYQEVDVEFHRTLLKGSQNEMLHALADPVEEALRYRIEDDWEGDVDENNSMSGTGGNQRFPRRPYEPALWLHHGLAYAVERGLPEAAETYARTILAEIRIEPLPDLLRVALRRTLDQLTPPKGIKPEEREAKDWEDFKANVLTLVDKRNLPRKTA
jgi:DNA-binding FadR family transcriptional regulator